MLHVTNMLRRRFFGWSVLFSIGISTCALASAANTTVIPKIARIGVATLGVTTIEQLEAEPGPGFEYTGGRPRGGRAWVLKNSDWYINADGFDYNQHGRVVFSFAVGESDSSDSDGVPFASVTRGSVVFLGSITPGMTEWKVKRVLRSHGVTTYSQTPSAITITETGRAYLLSDIEYTIWTAEIAFERGRVRFISLRCY
jgi:hypothetical protein